MVMEPHYDQHYFYADLFGGKKYVDSAGQQKTFGYAQGGMWSFQKILDKLMEILGNPRSVLDVGAGCGGFVATCNANWIEAVGLEFSQYAIDHAILGGEKYLKHWDLEETPWMITNEGKGYFVTVPIEDSSYDWVTAIDLFEHLFDDKIDQVIAETKRVTRRWIIAKICTAQRPHEVWAAKRGSYEEVLDQAKKEGFEWLIVSGHVNSQPADYWRAKFGDKEWRLRDDLAEKFKKDLKLPEDWRCTLICERLDWFEREFGRDIK